MCVLLETYFFTVPWKSSILSQQDLDAIKDKDNSTFVMMDKTKCSYIELWAQKLGWEFKFMVNITGRGRFSFKDILTWRSPDSYDENTKNLQPLDVFACNSANKPFFIRYWLFISNLQCHWFCNTHGSSSLPFISDMCYGNETVLNIEDWRWILISNLDFNELGNSYPTSETVLSAFKLHSNDSDY